MADAALKDAMNKAWMAWVEGRQFADPDRSRRGVTPGTLVEITVCAAK